MMALASCDDRPSLEEKIQAASTRPATRPAVDSTTAPVAAAPEAIKPLPLDIIPFVANAPESWSVKLGPANRMVLHGILPSGEFHILMSPRNPIAADAHAALVEQLKRAASQPSSGPVTRVTQRDEMTIIERIERIGDGTQSAELTPVSYNVRYMVPGPKLDYLVFEINALDLSQEMLDKDGELLRQVLTGLKYDPNAQVR